MAGVDEGWYEPEYNPRTARAWRWTAEKSFLWVRPLGRSVTLTLSGESPLKYFDRAPTVAVTVGTREVARFNPSSDFSQDIVLPAENLVSEYEAGPEDAMQRILAIAPESRARRAFLRSDTSPAK
jgi:hypothetical protein